MQSCFYAGVVTHQRATPVPHYLRYKVSMAYLDLDETEVLKKRGRLSRRRFSLGTFDESDHVFGQHGAIKQALRQFLARNHGLQLEGPVRLLTQLRVLGLYFSPLNLYYCFDSDGSRVVAVVAEVSNTPWNQRHHYVLCSGNQIANADRLEYYHPKQFHVSPFMPMEMAYSWRLSVPTKELSVRIETQRDDQPIMTAAMELERLELSPANLRRLAFRTPAAPVQILSGIYYQAFKLWWKKCPYYPHPKSLATHSPSTLEKSTIANRTP